MSTSAKKLRRKPWGEMYNYWSFMLSRFWITARNITAAPALYCQKDSLICLHMHMNLSDSPFLIHTF